VPVIASLRAGERLAGVRQLAARQGAHALELNVYHVRPTPQRPSRRRGPLLDVLRAVRAAVRLPWP
jgi:hypothetical protein